MNRELLPCIILKYYLTGLRAGKFMIKKEGKKVSIISIKTSKMIIVKVNHITAHTVGTQCGLMFRDLGSIIRTAIVHRFQEIAFVYFVAIIYIAFQI